MPSTFVPTAGLLTTYVSQPREFAIHEENKANFQGLVRRGGWAQLELTDALPFIHVVATLNEHSDFDFLDTRNLLGLKSIRFHEKGTNDYANNATDLAHLP